MPRFVRVFNYWMLLALTLKFELIHFELWVARRRKTTLSYSQFLLTNDRKNNSDIEMFRAFINQCEGEIIANRPSASPRTRALADQLQPSQQPSEVSEPTEESMQGAQEGNSPANGKKPFSCTWETLYLPIRFEYNSHTIHIEFEYNVNYWLSVGLRHWNANYLFGSINRGKYIWRSTIQNLQVDLARLIKHQWLQRTCLPG